MSELRFWAGILAAMAGVMVGCVVATLIIVGVARLFGWTP